MAGRSTDTLAGLPGVTPAFRAFVQSVRGFTRDFPELNRIVAGEESTDRQIAFAVMDALTDFNGTPPLTAWSLDDLLQRNLHYLLLRMTTISLLEQVVLLQMRNHINYSAGGINVGVNDKSPLLMNFISYLKAWVDQRKQQVKVAMNIESILGPANSGVMSEYWAVNAVYAQF